MAVKKVTAVKKTATAKKATAAKKGLAAKKVTAAPKTATAKGAKTAKVGKKKVEYEAIHYYLGPDGKVVKERLEYYEPKRLSILGEWMKTHPKGLLKLSDMKAVMR